MKYQIVRLVDHDGGYAWRPGEWFDTKREAVQAGEDSIKNYECMMYRVHDEQKNMVWESVTPLAMKAHY